MPRQPLFVGNPVLIVVDIQCSSDQPYETTGISHMPGAAERIGRVEGLLAATREAGLPVIFLQEVHRRSGVDFGRELDGTEGVHCLAGDATTELWPTLRPIADDAREFHIVKRRYSGFIGTELDIVLRGLDAGTLVLVGGLTDVCVHYTFADAHQRDYHVRVVEDCVGGSGEAAHAAALNAMEYLQAGARRSCAEVVEAIHAHHGALVEVTS
ncbi:MAG TPA: isochorismatase family cysteine hydrolase [Pseudonocardia sp.]|nr:isochorismatase family cysteine hydrolase [Pseudonocardia sp.]